MSNYSNENDRTRNLININSFVTPYLESLVKNTNQIKLYNILPNIPVNLPLELKDVYVPQKIARLRMTIPVANEDSALNRWTGSACKPLLEELVRMKKVIIYGRPGAGKTILVNYIANKYASEVLQTGSSKSLSETIPIPIVIRMRELASQNSQLQLHNLRDICVKSNFDDSCPENFFVEILDAFKCVILFDGLDEIPFSDRTKIADQICDFSDKYPNNNFLITSRPPLRELSLPNFSAYSLCAFSTEDVHSWASRWHFAMEQAQLKSNLEDIGQAKRESIKNNVNNSVESFIRELDQEDQSLRNLTSNPLVLTLVYFLYAYQDYRPTRREDIYDKCIDLLLEKWPVQRPIDLWQQEQKNPKDPIQKREALEKLAYWMHERGLHQVRAEKVTSDKVLEEYLDDCNDTSDFLEHAEKTIGLLVQQGSDAYSFSHDSFKDFLVASYECRQDEEGRNELLKKWHEPEWLDVILLYAGLDDTEQLIKGVLEEKDEVFRNNLIFAARCMEHSRKVNSVYNNQVFDELLKEFQTARYQGLQDKAQESLIRLGRTHFKKRVRNELFELLNSGKPDVQQRAALCLIRLEISSTQVVRVLVQLLDSSRTDDIRQNAIFAFGELVRKQSDKLKRELLKLVEDNDKNVVRCAIAAIGWLGLTTDDIVDTLLDRLKMDNHSEVRKQIVTTLEWLGINNEKVSGALLDSLNDRSEEVRGEAAFALGELVQTYVDGDRAGQSITNVLLQLLDSCSGYVCKRVVSTLGRMGLFQESVVKALINQVQNKEEDIEIRSRAASAIGELGSVDSRISAYERTVPVLLDSLRDRSEDIRGKSVTALALLAFASPEVSADKTVIEGVARLLNDDAVEVRRRAVSALSWLESTRVTDFKKEFLELLQEEGYQSHAAAAFGYLRYDDKDIIKELLALMNKSKDDNLREIIAGAFGRIGNTDEDIIGTLYSLMDESTASEKVRIASIAALGQLRRVDNSRVIKRLEKLLSTEENTKIRWHAAFALMNLGWVWDQQGGKTSTVRDKYNSVVKAILLSLNEKDEVTKLFGISALGQLEAISAEIVRTLVMLLRAKEARVRSASANSIFKLFSKGGSKLTEIVRLLHDEDEEIVQYATMALFITIRASKETISNILEKNDAAILEHLLNVDKEVWHPILNTQIKVKDVAWLLLHEYKYTSFVRVAKNT